MDFFLSFFLDFFFLIEEAALPETIDEIVILYEEAKETHL